MAANTIREKVTRGFSPRRRREHLDSLDVPTYVIGDVHGRYDLLSVLERKIFADAAALPGRKLIIMLGDFIDRGPASAQVVSRLMAPLPNGFDRICLTGNHELAMLAYADGEISLDEWVALGGEATLKSYGVDIQALRQQYPRQKKLDTFIRTWLPDDHLNFLRRLPILLDTPQVLFVHAGIDPERPIEAQDDDDLVYIRSRFYDSAQPLPKLIIHGHTPVRQAEAHGLRLNIDTGAFRSGKLTAARLWQGHIHITST
ncbi:MULTISPECIES: metallophosphoesterase [Rhizobium]|uniref:Serine/threonine protein phosphatase 1 n=1 Tax=Rhizobium paranaense TaxID=1650438 RepID=A0A7W9D539_9HYPH|nr:MULTISPECIES: metallophosphoesterase [Rhizobium]MBB5577566.1 serine/threonine protein phosphatase 1 [Rhizobium paranaense]PST64786.1 serine/threonine protein phosphatase [Rhizobium sp. SEMIA4064]